MTRRGVRLVRWGLGVVSLLALGPACAQSATQASAARASLTVTLTVLPACVERGTDGSAVAQSSRQRCAPRSARVRSPSSPREPAVLADANTALTVQSNAAERRIDVLF